MSRKIQHRRGPEELLPVLAEGELAFTTFTKKMFVGNGTDNPTEYLNAKSAKTVTFVSVTASKTLALTDATTFQTCTHATVAINLTVPTNASVAFPTGTQIAISMDGAAQVAVVAASGVTINPSTTLKISAQYKTAALLKTGTDTWLLSGSLKA